MPHKIVMGLLVACIALLVPALFAAHFDVALLRLFKGPTVPSTKQTKAASRSRSAPSESAPTAPASSKFDVARIDPEGVSVFAGRAPPNAQVTVLANGETIATTKADENGQWAAVVEHLFAPGEYQLSLQTSSNGSLTETNGGSVRITIAANANPPPAPSPSTKSAPLRMEVPSPPAPITFTYNEPNFTPAGRRQAAALSEFLNQQKLTSVTLSGHADERGTDEFNMELSRQRLEAVAHYLHASGYMGELKLVPKGKREPYLTPDRDRLPKEDAFQLDRRVELHLRQ